MEQKLTDILMEAAMKISSLTDSSVFILVENREGRRKFSGQPHLRDAYRKSRLVPTSSDVECLVDVDSKTVHDSSTISSAARGGNDVSRKRGYDFGNESMVVEPAVKSPRIPDVDDANRRDVALLPVKDPCAVGPLKAERDAVDDNEVIFLRDDDEDDVFAVVPNNEPLPVDSADRRRDVPVPVGYDPLGELPLPSASALEQSFDALFAHNEIQDVGMTMNFDQSFMSGDNDNSGVVSKVCARSILRVGDVLYVCMNVCM